MILIAFFMAIKKFFFQFFVKLLIFFFCFSEKQSILNLWKEPEIKLANKFDIIMMGQDEEQCTDAYFTVKPNEHLLKGEID